MYVVEKTSSLNNNNKTKSNNSNNHNPNKLATATATNPATNRGFNNSNNRSVHGDQSTNTSAYGPYVGHPTATKIDTSYLSTATNQLYHNSNMASLIKSTNQNPTTAATTTTTTNLSLINRIKTIDSKKSAATQSSPESPKSSTAPGKYTSANIYTNHHLNTLNENTNPSKSSSYFNNSNYKSSVPMQQASPTFEPAQRNFNSNNNKTTTTYTTYTINGKGQPSSTTVYAQLQPQQQQTQQQSSPSKTSFDSNSNDVYTEKISDQKFFSRNFKLKSTTNNNSNNINGTSATSSSNQFDVTTTANAALVDARLANNESPSNMDTTVNTRQLNYTNSNTSNANNRLKLLKKRNALKKTLAAGDTTLLSTTPNNLTRSSQNFDSTLHTSSKEDFKSQTSLNATGKQTFSVYLSRNSLNNLEGTIGNQLINKSNDTLDELNNIDDGVELKTLSSRDNNNNNNTNKYTNLNRVRSSPHINNTHLNQNSKHNSASASPQVAVRTKSENELTNLGDGYRLKKKLSELDNVFSNSLIKPLTANSNYLNKYKSTSNNRINNSTGPARLDQIAGNGHNSPTNTAKSRPQQQQQQISSPSTRMSFSKNKDDAKTRTTSNNTPNEQHHQQPTTQRTTYDANNEFRIVYPGFSNMYQSNSNYTYEFGARTGSMGTSRVYTLDNLNNQPVELFEASPYNIMSDPVICEQFRKLYEEDEYFQNVHKKCVEWLNKYVFPEMELRDKIRK